MAVSDLVDDGLLMFQRTYCNNVVLLDSGTQVDVVQFVREFTQILLTFFKQNKKYGSSWKVVDLGARGLYPEINAKIQRLKRLVWDTPDGEVDHAKCVETIRDTILYLHMMSRLLEIKLGPVDEFAVQKEVDAT